MNTTLQTNINMGDLVDEEMLKEMLENDNYKDTLFDYDLTILHIPTFQRIHKVMPMQYGITGKLKSDPTKGFVTTSTIIRSDFEQGWVYTESGSLYKLENRKSTTE